MKPYISNLTLGTSQTQHSKVAGIFLCCDCWKRRHSTLGCTQSKTSTISQKTASRLIELLQGPLNEFEKQIDPIKAITDMTCGKHKQVQAVIEAGGIPALTRLLKFSLDIEIQEHAVWALASIAETSKLCHEMVNIAYVGKLTRS